MSYQYELEMPCKLVLNSLASNGYGIKWCHVSRKNVGAHRLAYCEAHGLTLEDIKGKVVRHKCDVKNCIEPSHLELGTYSDNARDTSERGRLSHNKLTDTSVSEIRNRYVKGCKVNGARPLAKEYGVDPKTIRCAIQGSTWRHVKEVT